MMQATAIPVDVKSYISSFPKSTQKLLKELRAVIKKNAPDAEEIISYRMPAYKFYGMLVYFAGYENHVGFYPGASGVSNFPKEIMGYKSAKGSIQFPLDEPIPLKLVEKIVQFRVTENLQKAIAKKKASPKKQQKILPRNASS